MKPCPFCGCASLEQEEEGLFYRITCPSCFTQGPYAVGPSTAEMRWDERTDPPTPSRDSIIVDIAKDPELSKQVITFLQWNLKETANTAGIPAKTDTATENAQMPLVTLGS